MMTHEQKLKALLELNWTVRVSENPDDGGYLARVVELPSVLATGDTPEELEADLWAAIESTLSGYLHFNDPIPLPAGIDRLPWEPYPRVACNREQRIVMHAGEGWLPQPTLSSSVRSSVASTELALA